jgi:hypothetical protein
MPTRRVNAYHDYGVGHGEGADDGALMTTLTHDYEQGARVDLSECWSMNLQTPWRVGPGCEDIVFHWHRDPRQGTRQRINGVDVDQALEWSGPAGATIIDVRESSYVRFKGPAINQGTAGIAIAFDGVEHHITSQSAVSRALIRVQNPRSSLAAIAFSETAKGNNDFMAVKHTAIVSKAPGCGEYRYPLTTTAKSAWVRGAAAGELAIGTRVRGYDVGPAGGPFDAVVVETRPGKAMARLSHEATVSRRAAPFLFGESLGTGIVLGPNPNAHKTKFHDVNLGGFATALDLRGGGVILTEMQYTDCELCESLGNMSQPCRSSDTRMEFVRQYCRYDGAMPYKVSNIGIDVESCAPGLPFIDNLDGGIIELDGFAIENRMPHESCVFWRAAQGKTTSARLGRFGHAMTLAQFWNVLGRRDSHAVGHLHYVNNILPDVPYGTLDSMTLLAANAPIAAPENIGPGQMQLAWDAAAQQPVLVVKNDDGSFVRKRLKVETDA